MHPLKFAMQMSICLYLNICVKMSKAMCIHNMVGHDKDNKKT